MRVDYLNGERLCTNLFLNRTNGGVLAHNRRIVTNAY